MAHSPRDDEETEELTTLLLRLAHRNSYCLRVTGGAGDFVFRPIRDRVEQDESWISADLNDTSANAIRLDRNCGTTNLHEVLKQMGVPHEFEDVGAKELRMSLHHGSNLEEACKRCVERVEQRWKDRLRPDIQKSENATHSRD